MRKILSILFFIGVIFNSLSQSDSQKQEKINFNSYQIDNSPIKKIIKKSFQIDSIQITSKSFGDKIEVMSIFNDSQTLLITELYYQDGFLILLRFTEESEKPIDKEYLAKINEYYYENGKFLSKHYAIRLTSHAICMGIPSKKDWYEDFGFNKNLDETFLELYAELIAQKFRQR